MTSGAERDRDYLHANGASILQIAAWNAMYPRGYSSKKDMDDYLRGSNQ